LWKYVLQLKLSNIGVDILHRNIEVVRLWNTEISVIIADIVYLSIVCVR